MRAYVASRWSEWGKDIARYAMRQLRDKGHTVTHDWTTDEGLDQAEAARKDLDGVYTADALILIPMEGGTGEWVEFGVALARLIPIIVIRSRSERVCIFEHLPGVIHVTNLPDAIDALNVLGSGR